LSFLKAKHNLISWSHVFINFNVEYWLLNQGFILCAQPGLNRVIHLLMLVLNVGFQLLIWIIIKH